MNKTRSCRKCGAPLREGELGELCPACSKQTPAQTRNDPTLIMSAAELATVSSLPEGGGKLRYFGDYELIEEIARGGMGVVFKARQVSLNRIVAVKMILAGNLASEADVKRFRTEAEAVANLTHPNIVTIHEVGDQNGYQFFSMPYIEGGSLAKQVESGRWVLDDGRSAARLVVQVARAIQYAHEHGILHRDVKPGNILLDATGTPYVTDFGLAKRVSGEGSVTLEGAVLGTPSFMAPEQAAGRITQLTAAADVYSIGAVLYYLLTSRPPFIAESPLDILVQVLEGEVISPRALNPKMSAELEHVCRRCLEKSPGNRYASATELAEDLDRFLRSEPLAAQPMDLSARALHWARRRPALISRLIIVAICVVVAQITYSIRHHVPLSLHVRVMLTLATWAAVSALCQRVIRNPARAEVARFVWAGADAVLLTSVLRIIDAVEGPLAAALPALVVASGLWFRVSLVGFTTMLTATGYLILLLELYWGQPWPAHLNWHVVVAAILMLTGLVVAYLVHRVQVLGRIYERPVGN